MAGTCGGRWRFGNVSAVKKFSVQPTPFVVIPLPLRQPWVSGTPLIARSTVVTHAHEVGPRCNRFFGVGCSSLRMRLRMGYCAFRLADWPTLYHSLRCCFSSNTYAVARLVAATHSFSDLRTRARFALCVWRTTDVCIPFSRSVAISRRHLCIDVFAVTHAAAPFPRVLQDLFHRVRRLAHVYVRLRGLQSLMVCFRIPVLQLHHTACSRSRRRILQSPPVASRLQQQQREPEQRKPATPRPRSRPPSATVRRRTLRTWVQP